MRHQYDLVAIRTVLRAIAAAEDLTLQQLADRLDVSMNTLYDWTGCRSQPQPRNIYRIAALAGLRPEALIGGGQVPTREEGSMTLSEFVAWYKAHEAR